MKAQIAAASLVLGMVGTAHSATPEINQTKLPDEVRAKQIQDMKWGVFICWSFSTFAGKEWTPTRGKGASYFKATGCDTDQWCQTVRNVRMARAMSTRRRLPGGIEGLSRGGRRPWGGRHSSVRARRYQSENTPSRLRT